MTKPNERKKLGRPRERSADLPIYDSMEQCSGATKVPLSTLRAAKRKGCTAFSSNRVHLAEFLKWWFDQPESDGESEDCTDWSRREKRAMALLKEAALKQHGERTINFDVAANFVTELVGFLCAELDRWERELPASIAGKTEPEISEECAKQIALTKTNSKAFMKAWIEKKGEAIS